MYSFEFRERRGALLNFLSKLGTRWNVSLFHYRNSGGAYGCVLCAFEAPPEEKSDLDSRLRKLGFSYREETSDQAAILFLK